MNLLSYLRLYLFSILFALSTPVHANQCLDENGDLTCTVDKIFCCVAYTVDEIVHKAGKVAMVMSTALFGGTMLLLMWPAWPAPEQAQ